MATDADFDRALRQVLAFEGGYVNDPDDPGGATNRGITQATYDRWRGDHGQATRSVAGITDAEVRAIYYQRYWLASGAPSLPMPLALVHFDTYVNMRPADATKLLADSGGNVQTYLDARAALYRAKVAANPVKRKFLAGWLNRVASLAKQAGPTPVALVVGVGLGLILLRALARGAS